MSSLVFDRIESIFIFQDFQEFPQNVQLTVDAIADAPAFAGAGHKEAIDDIIVTSGAQAIAGGAVKATAGINTQALVRVLATAGNASQVLARASINQSTDQNVIAGGAASSEANSVNVTSDVQLGPTFAPATLAVTIPLTSDALARSGIHEPITNTVNINVTSGAGFILYDSPLTVTENVDATADHFAFGGIPATATASINTTSDQGVIATTEVKSTVSNNLTSDVNAQAILEQDLEGLQGELTDIVILDEGDSASADLIEIYIES